MYLSAQTAGSEREKRKEWGRGLGVRSEEEEKKGRLIIKVFQVASPWRSGTWRGFRGFGLSTSDLMPGMEECGSQSPWSPPTSPRLLLSHSFTPPDTLPPTCPLCPQSSQHWPCLTAGTIPLPRRLAEYISRFVHIPLLSPPPCPSQLLSPQAARPSFDFPINPGYGAWK